MATIPFDLEMLLSAIRRMDVVRILAWVADDVVVTDAATGREVRGKDRLRRKLEENLAAASHVDIAPEVFRVEGDSLAMLARVQVVQAHARAIPVGNPIPVGGGVLELSGAFFANVDERGRIHHLTRLPDEKAVPRQGGLFPQLGLAGVSLEPAGVHLRDFMRPDHRRAPGAGTTSPP